MSASSTDQAAVLAGRDTADGARPALTVAIPHYNHRRHLEVVLKSVFAQQYDDFEVVVSDDRSRDDSNETIPRVLEGSGRPFRYYAQPTNLGYDGNVRFCLAAARGRHVLLLGNDDALAGPRALRELAALLTELRNPEVAFANFEDWASPGSPVRRATRTAVLGAGPESAVQYFRSFSFVSGLIFEREAAARHETDRWDRSIYYQIYLASRIQAAGGRLAALDLTLVRKDVRVDGKPVPNYASKWGGAPWSFTSRHTGLDSVIRVTSDAVLPYLPPGERSAAIRRIAAQILMFSYAFWLFEYRRVANWSFAVGVARGLWPAKLLREYSLSRADAAFLWALYGGVTVVGLLLPLGALRRLSAPAAGAVRRLHQRRPSGA